MVLWKLYKRCMLFLFAYGIYVGAYCIRPVRHRFNRIANRRYDIANLRNSGRMQYAPTSGAIFLIICCLCVCDEYCIRPICHRMNRIANRRHRIVSRRNSGRMPYAPTVVQFTD